MSQRLLCILLAILCGLASQAQEFSVAEFERQWAAAPDEDKIALLGKYLPGISQRRKNQLLQDAIFIARDRGLKKDQGRLYMHLGMNWYGLGDYPKALENYQMALTLQESIKDYSGLGRTYNELATFVKKQKDFAKALA